MKTWTVEELITELQKLPSSSQIYLEDADTAWTIHLFDVCQGHIENGDFIGAKAILLRPCGYGNIDSSIDFKIEQKF